MERADRICRHPLWQAHLAAIAERERDRPFCRHGIAHLTDVARLAWIENLERGLGVPKSLIYAAALVHDLGRAGPDGVPHERAGLAPAREILDGCGFTAAERDAVLEAVSCHRNPETARCDGLAGLLYRADKASRLCLFCPSEPGCNWAAEKKNLVFRG